MLPHIQIQDLDLESLLELDTEALDPAQLLILSRRIQEVKASAPTRRAVAKKAAKVLSAPPPSQAMMDLMNL
jgi:hypothetical protein